MASYGFGLNSRAWNESKKGILAKALKELVEDMEGEDKFIGLTRGQKHYVQVDEPARGVTLVNLNYLTKEFQKEIIRRANEKYRAIMSEANSKGYVLSNSI